MIKLKNKNEIAKIRSSGKILAETFEKIKEIISPGITTKEIDAVAYDFIIKSNARPAFKGYMGYPASLSRVLKDGDIVSIDIGVDYGGFISDSATTLPVGKIDDKAKKLLAVTEECLYRGIEQAIEGNRISDISKAVFLHAKKNNFGVVRDFCGHGVGFNVHEEPQVPNYINNGPNPRIKNGLVIAIEPMINMGEDAVYVLDDKWTVKTADKSLSAHFEHTIAIVEGYAEILTLP
jgi:methionyl aminopeptidase